MWQDTGALLAFDLQVQARSAPDFPSTNPEERDE
jgi:hypothetical protein